VRQRRDSKRRPLRARLGAFFGSAQLRLMEAVLRQISDRAGRVKRDDIGDKLHLLSSAEHA